MFAYGNINTIQIQNTTVCQGSSDPTLNIESTYFIQSNSCDLQLFDPVNE